MNRTALLLLALVCTACAAVKERKGGTVQAYEGPAKSDAEVATLTFQTSKWKKGKALAYLSKLDGVEYGNDKKGYAKTAKALPGSRVVEVYCYVEGLKARPALMIGMEAGKSYDVSCFDDGGYVKIDFKPAAAPSKP